MTSVLYHLLEPIDDEKVVVVVHVTEVSRMEPAVGVDSG